MPKGRDWAEVDSESEAPRDLGGVLGVAPPARPCISSGFGAAQDQHLACLLCASGESVGIPSLVLSSSEACKAYPRPWKRVLGKDYDPHHKVSYSGISLDA